MNDRNGETAEALTHEAPAVTAEGARGARTGYRIDFTACRIIRLTPEPRRAAEPEPAAVLP